MGIRPKGAFQRQLLTVFNLGTIGDLTDGQLLERFATRGGEAAELAFAALVERHGRMVLRVCRHAAGDSHDAEDAFQATFLILVKQARSLWVRDSLAPWLHRVAHRVATRSRLSAVRMHEHERRAAAVRPVHAPERDDRDEIAVLLHEEIDRLPERYRVPVVLCDLQGVTHEKAARHLGWPVGTLKTRLARARELLRGRMSRRGLGRSTGLMLPATLPSGAFPFRAIEVVLPGTLVESTIRAAFPLAAGKALEVGVISSRVVILIEEVLKTMVVTKLKLASVVILIGAAGAAGVLAQQGQRPDSSGAVDRRGGSDSAQFRRPARGGSDRATEAAPAYIRQSRALIITRLEEEVAEAQARLDRTLRKFQSPEHPAVARASETLEALVRRLDKIDSVLVDVVETYPTMVDFSGGPGGAEALSAGEKRRTGQQQPARSQKDPGSGAPIEQPRGSQNDKGKQGQNSKGPDRGENTKHARQPHSQPDGHGSGFATADLDGDGRLDLYITNGGDAKQGPMNQAQQGNAQKSSQEQAPNNQARKRRPKAGSDEQGSKSQQQPGQADDDLDQQDLKSQSEKPQSRAGSAKQDPNTQPKQEQSTAVPF